MKSPPAAGAFRSSDAYQHAAARGDAGRAKSILEIFNVEQIVCAAEKRQRRSFGNAPFITPVEIGFGEAGESQLACAERKVVLEDWSDVRTRSIQIKAEQERAVSLIDCSARSVGSPKRTNPTCAKVPAPNLSNKDGARKPLPTCARNFVLVERMRYAIEPSPVTELFGLTALRNPGRSAALTRNH